MLFGAHEREHRGADGLADGEIVRFEAGGAKASARVRTLTERVVEVVARHADIIRERFPKTVRRNAGYQLDLILQQLDAGKGVDEMNLAPLLCGSEGTLAITLSARLRLQPIPRAKGLAVLSFPSVDDAIAAVLPISRRPSAVELLDDLVIDSAEQPGMPPCRTPPREGVCPAGRALRGVLRDTDAGEINRRFDAAPPRSRARVPVATYTDASDAQR